MTSLADVDGFKFFHLSVRVALLPTLGVEKSKTLPLFDKFYFNNANLNPKFRKCRV